MFEKVETLNSVGLRDFIAPMKEVWLARSLFSSCTGS
jgi:hypothetical protein